MASFAWSLIINFLGVLIKIIKELFKYCFLVMSVRIGVCFAFCSEGTEIFFLCIN